GVANGRMRLESVRSRTARVMKTLMRNGRDRRSGNPLCATRGKSACFWLEPISGSHQGPQPERLHLEAEYMAAPVSFRERSDSFPLHRGRRPYMAHSGFKPMQPHVGCWRKLTRARVAELCKHIARPPEQNKLTGPGHLAKPTN